MCPRDGGASEPRPEGPPRALVVVGASAGGVEALSAFVAELPADLAAAVLVVLHVSPQTRSVLPDLLRSAGLLPAEHAVDGEMLRAGHIYVAPPDHHLLVADGVALLDRGPRENGMRPAIDALFRSAAETWGDRAVGVVLSGMLDDGTAGLVSLKAVGGRACAQDVDEAAFPSMPASAARFVELDCIAPARGLARYVAGAVKEIAERAAVATAPGIGEDLDPPGPGLADEAGARRGAEPPRDRAPGTAAGQAAEQRAIRCPECGGVLSEREVLGVLTYQCRVGHAYTAESLFSQQQEMLERALWAAIGALEERAGLCERLGERFAARGLRDGAARRRAEAQHLRAQADLVRESLRNVLGVIGETEG